MVNRSKECIEFRNDHESKCYLVNSDTKHDIIYKKGG